MAKATVLRTARNRHPLAKGGIPQVLAMEESPEMAWKKEDFQGYS
ncbi:MAG: hypothetical protein ACYSWP_25565 [Planctomycetota bacterium]